MKIHFSATNILEVQHRKDIQPAPFSSKAVKYHILDLLNQMAKERPDLGLHIDYVFGLYYSETMVYRLSISCACNGSDKDDLEEKQAMSVMSEMAEYLNEHLDTEKYQLIQDHPACLSQVRELVIRKIA